MKRVIAFVLCVVSLMSLIVGCIDIKNVQILTRGEWITLLTSSFDVSGESLQRVYFEDVPKNADCFSAVSAAVDWNILEPGGDFNPSSRADTTFAIVTAVKAIGLHLIAKSVDGEELTTDDEIVDYFNKKTDVKYIKGSSLYTDTAAEIITQVNSIYNSLELKKYQNICYNENVTVLQSENVRLYPDGKRAFVNRNDIKMGEIFVVSPCPTYPDGLNLKVTGISDDAILYEQATLQEIFSDFELIGTYDVNVLGIIPSVQAMSATLDGEIVSAKPCYIGGEQREIFSRDPQIVPLWHAGGSQEFSGFSTGKIEFDYDGIVFEVSMSVEDIKATIDLEMHEILGLDTPFLDVLYVSLSENIKTSISVTGEFTLAEQELLRVPCEVYGVGITFILKVSASLEGEVAFTWSVDANQSLEYDTGLFATPKYSATANNPKLDDMEFKTSLNLKISFAANLTVVQIPLVNVGVASGVTASASTKNSKPGCVDLALYVPMTVFIGADDKETLLGQADIKWKKTIWDASNSKLKKLGHLENDKFVDKCKYDETDKEANENGWLSDILKKLNEEWEHAMDIVEQEFASARGSGLEISVYYAVVEEGQSERLDVESLPNGYHITDLIFTSSDETVAVVDNAGRITGISKGGCTITVSTKDGKYSQVCALNILASYDVDFTPLA